LDGWLCQDCLSVNRRSAGRCYKCHVPRKFGELPDGAPVPTRLQAASAPSRDPVASVGRPRPALSDYRSSRRRSWYVLALLTVTVGFSTLSLAMLQANGGTMGLAIRLMQRDLSVVGSIVAVSLIGLVLTVATAVAWFVWFDRVLQNVPPLTGRWTELGRVAAVTWWLVPLVGLFRGPYVVGQVYDRVRVRTSPGLWLLGLWAMFWLGGTIAPAIASRLIGFLPLDLLTLAQLEDMIAILGQVSYVVAGLFAAALVLAFEHAQEVRATGATNVEPVRDDAEPSPGGVSPAPLPQSAPSGQVQGATGAGRPNVLSALPGGPIAADDGYRIRFLPGIPLAVMGGAVVVGLAVGVLMGQAARPVDVLAAARSDPAESLVDVPQRPVAAAPLPTPTATPDLTPTPIDPRKRAREVVRMFASDGYRGGMEIQGAFTEGDGAALSTLEVMRSGDREWSESHLGNIDGEPGEDLERVILGSEVWERTDTTDWIRRDRTGRDRPTPPLPGLTDPDDLEYLGQWPEGEADLRAYRWQTDTTTADRSLAGRLGVGDATRTAATLLVTAAGEPVRSLLSYTGVADGRQVKLDVVTEFHDVMARILIRSPRAGPPALVRAP
jgi:hypothetical protein